MLLDQVQSFLPSLLSFFDRAITVLTHINSLNLHVIFKSERMTRLSIDSWETETGGSLQVQDQSGLHSKFCDIQGYSGYFTYKINKQTKQKTKEERKEKLLIFLVVDALLMQLIV